MQRQNEHLAPPYLRTYSFNLGHRARGRPPGAGGAPRPVRDPTRSDTAEVIQHGHGPRGTCRWYKEGSLEGAHGHQKTGASLEGLVQVEVGGGHLGTVRG